MTDQVLDATPAASEPAKADTSSTVTQPTTPPVTPSTPAVTTEAALAAPTTPSEKGSSILPNAPEEKYWKDDWKQKIAGEDAKMLKGLEKYESPADLAKAYSELQTKFSKTRPLPQLAKDATPEQVKEYREAAGIPQSWDKYDTTLDKGLVIGDADKPIVESYLKEFHEANLKPDDVKKVLQIHFEKQNCDMADAMKIAEDHEKEVTQSLRQELGPKYDESINMASNYLKSNLGDEAFDKLRKSIAPDGTLLLNDQKILSHFFKLSREKFGNATQPPAEGANLLSLTARKTELEKLSKANPKLWYDSADLREEYNQLTTQLTKK